MILSLPLLGILGPGAIYELESLECSPPGPGSFLIWIIFTLAPDLNPNPYALPPVVQQGQGSLKPFSLKTLGHLSH